MTELVYIWSAQWHLYWRPKAEGYTAWAHEAGRWSRDEAQKWIDGCGPEKQLKLIDCPAESLWKP